MKRHEIAIARLQLTRILRTHACATVTMPCLTLICLSMVFSLGCGDDPTSNGNKIVYQAPAQSRAMWVLEPATIGIGDVATLELAVVTRPNHRVLPFATPKDVSGIWILEVETLPVASEPNRWVHRTRVRIRPREVGQFDWPATPIEVEGDGVVETLTADGLTVEVVSIIPRYIGKLTPFGLGPELAEPTRSRPWMWAAGGAGFALGCLGLLWLARRESNRPQTTASSLPPGVPAWETALEAIEVALDQVDRDPIRACESASVALRCYMDQRFGSAATTHTIASTTEELERTTPPFAATSRWPGFVLLLRRLDRFRFPAPTGVASAQAGAREIIRDAASFVRDTIPVEVAR